MKVERAVSCRSGDAIEQDGVVVRVEPQVGLQSLDDGDRGAVAARDAALNQRSSLPAEHGIDEDAVYATEQLAVVSGRSSQLKRHREHKLTERNLLRQNVIDPVGGAFAPCAGPCTKDRTLAHCN
jgi:hypothetical protein